MARVDLPTPPLPDITAKAFLLLTPNTLIFSRLLIGVFDTGDC